MTIWAVQSVAGGQGGKTDDWVFRLRSVQQTFGGCGGVVLPELDIVSGTVTALMGCSGSGKSTLLHILGGMLDIERTNPATEFTIRLPDDRGVPVIHDLRHKVPNAVAGRIAYIFQQPLLFREASCRQNLEMSVATAGKGVPARDVTELWTSLGLEEGGLTARARSLSGGMQQRLAVARALIRRPTILIADEPTANLDHESARTVMRLLIGWQVAEPGRTLIWVTHDEELAATYADHIIVLHSAKTAETCPSRSVGGLLPDVPWPQPNPYDDQLLRAWMKADPGCEAEKADSKTVARFQSRRESECREYFSRREDTDLVGVVTGGAAKPMAAPIMWLHMAVAQVFSSDSLANLANRWRGVWAVVGGICALSGLSGLFLDRAYGEGSAATAVSSDLLAVFWALLALLGLILASAMLTRRVMNLGTLSRACVLAVLVLTGVTVDSARTLIQATAEQQLNSPDLQPQLLSNAGPPLTRAFIDSLQCELQKDGLVPWVSTLDSRCRRGEAHPLDLPDDADQWSLFGRYTLRGMSFYLPSTAEGPPRCDSSDRGLVVAPAGLGLAPFDLRRTIGTLDGGGEIVPLLEERKFALGDHELIVSRRYLESNLGLPSGGPPPGWVCVDPKRTSRYEPFKIIALLDRIPGFDKTNYAFILSLEAVHRALGMAEGSVESFDLISVWMEPKHRKDILGRITEWGTGKAGQDKRVTPEVGFEKVRNAMTAALVASYIGYAFAGVVALMAGAVTVVFASQSIDQMRRELAVARAFGARFHDAAVFMLCLIGIPLLLALAISGSVCLTVLPLLAAWALQNFGLPPESIAGPAGSFAVVALVFVGLLGVVSMGTLGVWWCRGRSLSRQLQEVG